MLPTLITCSDGDNTATDFCPQPGAGYFQPGAGAFALDLAVAGRERDPEERGKIRLWRNAGPGAWSDALSCAGCSTIASCAGTSPSDRG